jgi:peptide subunit release factor RF-3
LANKTRDVAVFDLLDQLGGYAGADKPATTSLTSLLAALLKVNGASVFDLYVDTDPTHRSKLAVFLDLPQRGGHFTRLMQLDPNHEVSTK